MKTSTLLALALVAIVAGLALWLRRQGESAAALPAPPSVDDPSPELDDEDDDDEGEVEWEVGDAAAVTVDGLAFIGEAHGVSLVPTPDPEAVTARAIVPVEFLRPGDFSAARVVRGAPSMDPWRLELLGPEGEYVSFGFAAEEAARVALDLLETRAVMRYVMGDDGRPLLPSAEQFAEARLRRDETERLLALGDGEGAEPLQ
jgi:hypothetical protein